MKVLITGSAGQLGRALVGSAPAGADVHCVDLAECDLADAAAITALVAEVSPDLVINAAAYTAVDKAESDENTARAINAGAVAALVAAHPGKLLHVSTDFVFDGQSARAYRPEDARNPLSAYGRTKAEGEDHLRPTDLLVRTAWVYTAGGDDLGAGGQGCCRHLPSQRRGARQLVRFRRRHPGRGAGAGPARQGGADHPDPDQCLPDACHAPGVHLIDCPVDYTENDQILNKDIKELSKKL